MSCSVQIKSRNTVKMKKVNNVVHRTTSETLRLNEPEVLTNNTSRQALSAISPPILKKSSCSFQITGVSLTQRTDLGDDSADDLDESHTDDISRVTDNETPSFSEDTCSRDTEDNIVDSCSALCSVTVIPTVPQFELENILSAETSFITTAEFSETSIDRLTFLGDMASNPPTTTKNQRFPGTRFTVVKIETGVPVRRGRWECLDYIDNSVYTPKHALTYNSPTTSDLSSTNTQPHYTMTPTTPTSNPMQGNFAALGTNYIDTVNKLLQSLSPPIPGMAQALLASSSSLVNQQLSPGAAVPPSLSSPLHQDYTAILTNLISAQMSKTTTTQQLTTLPLDLIRALQSQPSMYATPTHGSVSATQIPRTFVQSLYSSPSLPITSITTLGSETLIQNQISGYCMQPSASVNQGLSLTMQRGVQSQPTLYSTQLQGQVQQQTIYSSPTLGSTMGYLPQHSTALITSNQSSPLLQRNVQINPTVYSTPPTQNQAPRYASPMQGQIQQQPIYSTPQAFSQPAAPVSQTLYSTQSPSFTSNVQGSASATQFQPQVPLQPTSYSTQPQGTIDYVTQAKQIIMQLQLQNQSQIQLQNTTYSTTLASQASLPALGQSSSYVQQPQVQICAPQIQRQISAPPVYNQSSTYLPQQSNTSYSSLPQVLTTTANLMPQVLSQPQVPNQSTSFVSLPQNQTNLTSLPSQPSTNYLFQSQPSNYVSQPFTYQATNSSVTVSQTSANQASYSATSVQSEAQQSTPFRRSQFSNDPHHSFSAPQTADHLSDPYIPSHLHQYSSNVLQTSCSVIQLHKQGQPASYVALPQEHGAYMLHHVPSLTASLPRKSASAHQSRFHTQTSIHSYLPHTEKSSPPYVHQPGPTHNLTHQVSSQKRRLVGQTLNFSLEPEIQSVDLDSHSSVFSFHNRAICSTYSKVKDQSKVVPHKSIFLPHDSTTVTASIMKPIATGSVTPVKTPYEKSGIDSNFLDKLKYLDLPHSSSIDVVEKLERVLDAGATSSDIAVMELKPAANNTSAIIDTKIEQAMDLVKSHLLYTVREEVEVLKLRISELLTRINQLEKENSFLKANATPEVLTALNTRSEEVQTDETSFSTDAAPQEDATIPAVPIE